VIFKFWDKFIPISFEVVYIWRGWDSTNSTSMKNSRFSSNKTKKLTKIVNRKPKINQKKLGHYEGYELILPKIMKKNIKIELFASFCMEFKLKYYKKSSKTIKFTTNFLRQHDSYPLKTQEK
jgi:hypothetical protein